MTAKQKSVHNSEPKGDSDKKGSWCRETNEESSDEDFVEANPMKHAHPKFPKIIMNHAQSSEYDRMVEGLKTTQMEMDC